MIKNQQHTPASSKFASSKSTNWSRIILRTAAPLLALVAIPPLAARAANPTGTFDLATKTWSDGTMPGMAPNELDKHHCWVGYGNLWVTDGADIIITGTSGVLRVVVEGTAGVTLSNATLVAAWNYEIPFLVSPGADATLTLAGNNILTAGYPQAGLQVGTTSEGATLTLNGAGSLTATGGVCGAGIGGEFGGTGGTITINGGTITAIGGKSAAGIGSGYGASCNVTINGGTILADSYLGAGIGGGGDNTGGAITINGGTLTAHSEGAASLPPQSASKCVSRYSTGCKNSGS